MIVAVVLAACTSAPAPTSAISGRPPTPSAAAPSATPVATASATLTIATKPTWTLTGSMIEARSGFTATRLADGRVLIVGGWERQGDDVAPIELASAELYDPGTGRWSATGSMAVTRIFHTATLLPDGRVLVVGGADTAGAEEAGVETLGRTSAETYDPRTGVWTATGSMATSRGGHSATLLPDGTVLVVGGAYADDAGSRRAERYAPTTGRWTAMVSMGEARSGHSAVLLQEGSVLVLGGVGLGSDPIRLDSAEAYDPIRDRWTPVASPDVGAVGQGAILLADGKVLATGGGLEGAVIFELYDPDSGQWSTTTTIPEPRRGFTLTLLANGTVLATGGGFRRDDAVCCVPSPAARTYNPANRQWTATASMSEARYGHRAILLADGTVLVMGGTGESGDLTSAEIFTPAKAAG